MAKAVTLMLVALLACACIMAPVEGMLGLCLLWICPELCALIE